MNLDDMNWYHFEAMRMEVDLLRRHNCINELVETVMSNIAHEVCATGTFSEELRQTAIEIHEFLCREDISELYNHCVSLEEEQRI